MSRTAAGDDAAFEALVNRHQGGLIQFFTMLSRNGVVAEDLAQEAFIRVYNARNAYQPRAKFKTYLFSIARNLWIDYLRRAGKRAGEESLEALECRGLQLGHDDPEPRPFAHRALYHAVQRLPLDQRMVLLLAQVEDMNYPEIAETLSIPVGTVKSRMFHALRKMRAFLKQR